MAKLSSFIITKNEEEKIATAISSVKAIAAEVIVIDSGSTDHTVQIAKNLGAQVIYNKWPGYVAQKAFAESICKHEWILNIDADEELSSPLQEEIAGIFRSNSQNKYAAYTINVLILHRNDLKPRLFAPANRVIRMYNKKFCSFNNSKHFTTHDAVLFNKGINSEGKIYNLQAIAYHRSGSSIEQLVNKANFYSTEQAKDMIKNGRNVAKIRIVFEMFVQFFKIFFIRRYFIFGFNGFIDSVIFAFTRFIRLAKTRENHHKKR